MINAFAIFHYIILFFEGCFFVGTIIAFMGMFFLLHSITSTALIKADNTMNVLVYTECTIDVKRRKTHVFSSTSNGALSIMTAW